MENVALRNEVLRGAMSLMVCVGGTFLLWKWSRRMGVPTSAIFVRYQKSSRLRYIFMGLDYLFLVVSAISIVRGVAALKQSQDFWVVARTVLEVGWFAYIWFVVRHHDDEDPPPPGRRKSVRERLASLRDRLSPAGKLAPQTS